METLKIIPRFKLKHKRSQVEDTIILPTPIAQKWLTDSDDGVMPDQTIVLYEIVGNYSTYLLLTRKTLTEQNPLKITDYNALTFTLISICATCGSSYFDAITAHFATLGIAVPNVQSSVDDDNMNFTAIEHPSYYELQPLDHQAVIKVYKPVAGFVEYYCVPFVIESGHQVFGNTRSFRIDKPFIPLAVIPTNGRMNNAVMAGFPLGELPLNLLHCEQLNSTMITASESIDYGDYIHGPALEYMKGLVNDDSVLSYWEVLEN